MGLLNGGISALFGAALSGMYLPATLFGGEPIYDPDNGNITGHSGNDVSCRAQIDAIDWSMRDGYIEGDVKIIILAAGLPGPISADHTIEVQGAAYAIEGGYQRWSISAPSMDAAGSHWVCRGRRA